VGALLRALLALSAGDAAADLPAHLALDAGVCPSPLAELPSSLERVTHEQLLPPAHDLLPVLSVASFPPFASPRAVQLELRMLELPRRALQLRVATLPEARTGRRAAAKVRVAPVDDELARLLEDAWAAALARTQHVAEVLVARAPNGGRVIVRRADGTYHVFQGEGRAGFTTTVSAGTPFGELVAAIDALAAYVEAPATRRPELRAGLAARLRPLPGRFAREACLRAEVPGN